MQIDKALFEKLLVNLQVAAACPQKGGHVAGPRGACCEAKLGLLPVSLTICGLWFWFQFGVYLRCRCRAKALSVPFGRSAGNNKGCWDRFICVSSTRIWGVPLVLRSCTYLH